MTWQICILEQTLAFVINDHLQMSERYGLKLTCSSMFCATVIEVKGIRERVVVWNRFHRVVRVLPCRWNV